MKTSIECCRNCTDKRHIGCHATCQEYKDELAEMHADKARYKARTELDAYIIGRTVDRYDSRVKYLRRMYKK